MVVRAPAKQLLNNLGTLRVDGQVLDCVLREHRPKLLIFTCLGFLALQVGPQLLLNQLIDAGASIVGMTYFVRSRCAR